MSFIVVITIKYLQLIDMGGLRLQQTIETDIPYSNGSRCKILIASVIMEMQVM